jgi:hypothetical protein
VRSGLIKDVRVVESSATGILILLPNRLASAVTLERVYVAESMGSGISANAFGSGVTLAVTIRDSAVVHNSKSSPMSAGISVFGQIAASNTRGTVENTVVSRNGEGISVGGSGGAASVVVSHSQIVDNGSFALKNGGSGAVLYTRGDNTIRGNNGQETVNQTSDVITSLGGG